MVKETLDIHSKEGNEKLPEKLIKQLEEAGILESSGLMIIEKLGKYKEDIIEALYSGNKDKVIYEINPIGYSNFRKVISKLDEINKNSNNEFDIEFYTSGQSINILLKKDEVLSILSILENLGIKYFFIKNEFSL